MNRIQSSLAALTAVLLLPAAVSASSADGEREALLATQKTLSARIESLKGEQDFLLFEKTAFSQDSKYLLLNIAGKRGQLKYKQRVLKDISIQPQSKHLERLRPGPVPLTLKIDGPKSKRALVFGSSLLVIARAGDPGAQAGLPRLVLSRRDFRSIFTALERGALLYVLP